MNSNFPTSDKEKTQINDKWLFIGGIIENVITILITAIVFMHTKNVWCFCFLLI